MAASQDLIRAFLALPIDPAARSRVAQVMEDLRPLLRGLRWVSTQGWHLTLRFLGPSTPEALDHLSQRLRGAASACPAGEGRLGDLGLFPERGSPRVLWLDLELPEPVRALQQACEAAARAAGFAPEDRPFRSHLTLGRWRERVPRPQLPSVGSGVTRLDEVILFRSDLRPQGALYRPLEVFPLARP
jgi:2'-5' RNA ligase